jgi:hypothetical protein
MWMKRGMKKKRSMRRRNGRIRKDPWSPMRLRP